MQTQDIKLIAVSSNNKQAYLSTENDPCHSCDLRKDEGGRLYFCLNLVKHYLPSIFQPKNIN